MAGEAFGTARNTLFMIKSTECADYQGDQGIDASNPTKIPPLGTVDGDGNPTDENDNLQTTKGANFLRSQAVMGAFQFIEGKSAVSIQIDNEKFDFQDLNSTIFKREFFKGGETMSGTIEFAELRQQMYWLGAALGEWNSNSLEYGTNPQYRKFEIWAAVNPNKLDTDFTSCDILYKLINVSFDNANANFENPIKHSLPFSFSDIRIVMNYDADVGVIGKGIASNITTGDLAGDNNGKNGQTLYLSTEIAGTTGGGLDAASQLFIQSAVGPSNAPNGDNAHTRFLIVLRELAMLASPIEGSLKVIVKGRDPLGRKQTEEFFIADLRTTIAVSPVELLTNGYWDGDSFSLTFVTKQTGTGPNDIIMDATGIQVVDVLSVDWRSQDGIPVIEV